MDLFSCTEVCSLLSISRSFIYSHMEDGTFPKPIKLGAASRWKASDIQEYIGIRSV